VRSSVRAKPDRSESAHPSVTPDRERHEDGQDAHDPGKRTRERVRHAAGERQAAPRPPSASPATLSAIGSSQLGKVETGTKSELAKTSGNNMHTGGEDMPGMKHAG